MDGYLLSLRAPDSVCQFCDQVDFRGCWGGFGHCLWCVWTTYPPAERIRYSRMGYASLSLSHRLISLILVYWLRQLLPLFSRVTFSPLSLTCFPPCAPVATSRKVRSGPTPRMSTGHHRWTKRLSRNHWRWIPRVQPRVITAVSESRASLPLGGLIYYLLYLLMWPWLGGTFA